MILTFKEFIEKQDNYKSYFFEKERLFQITSSGYEEIAKKFIYVDNIFLQETYLNGIILEVHFNYNKGVYNRYQLGVFSIKLSNKGKITTFDYRENDEKEFMEIIKSTYKKKHKSIILRLYKDYFQYYIIEYIKTHPAILAKCGWLSTPRKKEFLSITYTSEFYPDFINDLFDGKVTSSKKLNNLFLNLCKESNTTDNLFEFIVSDPCIFTVFAYSIHSVSWNYVHGYSFTHLDKNYSFFSLCIYGNEPSLSKKLANLLLNFFTIKSNKWNIIERKYHISATSLSQKTMNNLFLYKSIPIIITSKNNHFTRTSSIIRKIHQKREDNKIHIYPVYISNSPIFADEILNCCSDSLSSRFEKINVEELREQFIALIYNYINYLSNISDTNGNHHHNLGKLNHIKPYSEEYIYFNNLDVPLLKEWLYKNFNKNHLNDVILKEWLENHQSEERYNLKKRLLEKWLRLYNLNEFSKKEKTFETILQDILSAWNHVETIPEFNIPMKSSQGEEILRYKIFNDWKCQQIKFNTLRKNLITKWLDTHFPEFMLYQTINIFYSYLKITHLEEFANSLKNYAEKCFLPQTQKQHYEPLQSKLNYLKLLYSFIQESLNDSKNETWIWEGQESRGEKELCYYLSFKEGLKKFNEFLSKSSLPEIQKREFDKLLKKNKILKLPNEKSNTLKRKKVYVYVFIKEELDKFSK